MNQLTSIGVLRGYTIVILCTLLYCEWLEYWGKSFTWSSLSDPPGESVRLLLVADPQIQGWELEPSSILGALTRWDADRFLDKTFHYALKHAKPDLVIFLGDLLDEGSTADEKAYQQYVQRFRNIFHLKDLDKWVAIPGDNDIGGEGSDRVTEEKVRRFKEAFGEKQHLQYDFLEIIHINRLVGHVVMPSLPKHQDRIRVLVSHIPLIAYSGSLPVPVNGVDPLVIFSAHDHKAIHIEMLRSSGQRVGMLDLTDQLKVYKFKLSSSSVHELMVPTCSYRMGTTHIGYGVAQISLSHDGSGVMEYTILWMPSRFYQLFAYLGLVLSGISLLLLRLCWNKLYPVTVYFRKRDTFAHFKHHTV